MSLTNIDTSVNITLLIILITCIVSLLAFNRRGMFEKMLFYPYKIYWNGEWPRFITSGFIHSDIMHLAVNMFVLYSFGGFLEKALPEPFPQSAALLYIILYAGGLVISDIPTYFRHRKNPEYRALGASGAVSSVVFASILINPVHGGIGLLFLPGITLPPYLFGGLYLIYSALAGRTGKGHINHEAHLYGAIFGLLFPAVLKPELFSACIEQIKNVL